MFRWFQDQIHKKKSDRTSKSVNNQFVEIATDAVACDGFTNPDQEPVLMGGSPPSCLTRIQLLQQRQNPIGIGNTNIFSETQETEEFVALSISDECSQGSDECSAMTRREAVSVGAHHHCCQENLSTTSSTQQLTEDPSFAQKVMGSSSNLQKQKEGPSLLKIHKESIFGQQEYIDNTTGSLQDQRESKPISQEYQSSVLTQEHGEDPSSPQEYIKVESTSSPHEHGGCMISPQEHNVNNSSQFELTKTSVKQDHRDLTFKPQQEPTESNSSSLKCIESSTITQKHTECSSNTQKSTTSIFKSPEPDTCHDCSNPHGFLNNTHSKSIVDKFELWSNPSLASPTSEASVESRQDPPPCPENSGVHQRLSNTFDESQKTYEEQENKTMPETESEMNLSQKSGQYVNEVFISHLQQKATSEKIRENDYNNEEHLSPDAMKVSVAHGAIGTSDIVRDSLPNLCLEREFNLEYDKESAKIGKKAEAAVVKVDKHSQTLNTKYQCANPYCYPQACLYNQEGRKCTILGEHFILTYIRTAPVLVSTAIENTDTGPMGCMIAWCSGKATEFRDLPDGTEIYFDAVVAPKPPKFVAIVIWQDTKPTYSVEPFFNCFVIVELLRNCPIEIVSFSKEHGVVSTLIKGERMNVMFSKSVVYIGGQQTESAQEIKKLSNSTSKQLYADVLKLMKVDRANIVTYEYMCSCVWLGCKPGHLNHSTIYDPLKLYKKASSYFTIAGKQSLLLCDVDAFLEIENTNCKIAFEDKGRSITLSCDKNALFSGNKKALPVRGKVKVHLRKTFAKHTFTWRILMVQVQPWALFETATSDTQPHHTNEVAGQPSPQATPTDQPPLFPNISTESYCESVVLPDVTDLHQATNGFTESDLVLRPQCTSTTSCVRKGVNPQDGEAAVMNSNVSDEEHLELISENPCISEMSSDSILEEESQEAAINVENQVEFLVNGSQCSRSDGVISQDNQHAPLKVINNDNGVLKNIGESFILETELQGKKVHIEMGKTPWVAFEDGKGRKCQIPMPDLPVQFDAYFMDVPLVGHILALWHGKKPLKASLENCTYYFDAPAVYHGSDEEGCFVFMVLLEEKVDFITTTTTTAIFDTSGEQCASLTKLSHVFLHLSSRQSLWTLFLVVLQPKDKSFDENQGANRLTPKLLSLPEPDALRSFSLNSPVKTKTNNKKLKSAKCKTSRVAVPTRYLRNLTGVLTEASEKRFVYAYYKKVPFSVEVPESCIVDVNTLALNVKEISLGTKIQLDAFCENRDDFRYRAAVVWVKKKPRKSVAHTGCIYYFNVSGRCLNSNEKEVHLEFNVENETVLVLCKTAYIIMPDGTSQDLESLKVDTNVHANLLQQNQNVSVNDFIYVDTTTAQPPLAFMEAERKPEEDIVTRSMTEEINQEKTELSEPPSNALIDNLKNSEVKLECSLMKSMTASTNEVAAATPVLNVQKNEYDVVKGTISQLQQDMYIFSSDSENINININPMKIAMDPHASHESPTGEFYLVYHKATELGVCGWYRPQIHQVYLQLGMVVHTHNLDHKIITLALPDHSSHYNFLFDSEIIVTGNEHCRFQQQLKSGKRVYPLIEDINPILIDGCVVSHRIIFITTLRGLANVCLNFFKHSLFGNEKKNIPSNGSIVSMNYSLSKDNDEANEDSKGRSQYEEQLGTSSLIDSINTDASLNKQQQVKQKNEIEHNSNESLEFFSTSEDYTFSEISTIQPQVNNLLDKYYESNLPIVDGEGETLRELIITKHPRVASKTYMIRYVTVCGEIQPGNSGTHVFCSRKIPFPVAITHNLPHCDANVCERGTKTLMMARKKCAKETGIIAIEPIIVWPEERKCHPYIVVTNKVSRKKNFLLVTDASDGKEKWYLCDYNLVFSLQKSYKIDEVIESHSKQGKILLLYAVVDKLPPFQIEDQYIEGNILFLTTSKNVAVTSIDVFIGSCHEEEFLYQEPLSLVLQTLHLHKIRMDRASKCKRGLTYYSFAARHDSFDLDMKTVGGCLEAHMDDFAIISCGRKSSTVVCHLSNVYYQGENIVSWDTIPKHHWKNFSAIILPLDNPIKESKWEIDGIGLVAWCCRGPRVVAVHQCYYHVTTPFVPYHQSEESQEILLTNLLQSQGSSTYSLESSPGTMTSLSEQESWQCRAGSTIFAFHDSILQSCGLIKMNGKVTLVNGTDVLFTSTENVVKCKISDIFINCKRCKSVKDLASKMDQIFTILAPKCLPITYPGKTIQMVAIIAFTAHLKSTGIHVCSKHTCILEGSLHKEEIAIAEKAFLDIAVLCEQSAQCSNYYLSKITSSDVETTMSPDIGRVQKHTLCYGFVMDIDKESPDQVRVSLHQGPESLTLPLSRSRLMGLDRDLSLQHVVGHPLKVILNSATRDQKEEYKILLGWENFSKDSNMSSNSTLEPKLPSPKKSKFHCCSRGCKVNEFQFVYNSEMFDVKSLYKLKKVDLESGLGFFHYWLDEKLTTCKKEYIMGWPKVNQIQELWNLLVAKGPQTGERCLEALAAWRGDSDSLVVEVCDVHGTHGLNISGQDKRKIGNECIPSTRKRGRRNSEPPRSDLSTSYELTAPSRYRRNSETLDISMLTDIKLRPSNRYRRNSEPLDINMVTDVKLRPSNIVEDNNSVLSRSLPCRTDYPFGSGLYINSREYKQNNSGSATLLCIEEDYVADENKVYSSSESKEQFHNDASLCTSSVGDENEDNLMLNLESERDNSCSIVIPKLTTIKSNSFICLDGHHGLIIDSLSHTVALVRHGRLYINKMKFKESLKQLFALSNLGIITAVVVPLTSHTSAELTVTHEAALAWLGSRPAGVGSIIKNINMMPCQPENVLLHKTKVEEKLECDPDTPYEYSITFEARNAYRGTLWPVTVTLKVLLRKLEIILGCFVEGYADHCGILISSRGPVLFDRKLFDVTLPEVSTPGTLQFKHEAENLKALVLELEHSIGVLGFEVKKIAVMIWSEGKPVIDVEFIKKSLNVYKMNWSVEFIGTFDQLEMENSTKVLLQNRVPSNMTRTPLFPLSSKKCDASEDIEELVAFCYPLLENELSTVLSIEDKYVVFGSNNKQVLALWEDIWCQKEIIKVGMKLRVVHATFSKPLTIFAYNFICFAVLVYKCDREPEAGTVKFNWKKGITEKYVQIRGKQDSKIMTINLQVKIYPPLRTQPNTLELLLLPQSLESMEDMTLGDECELVKVMDECGILKVKNTKEIKVFFEKSVVLINNKALPKQKWKKTLKMLLDQKQTWQCSGQNLTPQETKSIKEATGEEVQYKARLVWCKTCTSTQIIQNEAKTAPGTALAPKALSIRGADFRFNATQPTDDTEKNISTKEGMQPCKSSECLSVPAFHPSPVCSSVSSWSELLLQNEVKTEENFLCIKGAQSDQDMHTPHSSSLWAARPTLRIIHGNQETVSECIVGGYAGHCGILASVNGPILFDKKLIGVTQQEKIAPGTPQSEQKENLKAWILELQQPVEILGCKVRKIAMVVWSGENPTIDNGLLAKSLDIYRLNWIVVFICNVSILTKKNYKLKPSVCHSFSVTSSSECDTSCYPEVQYYCSQEYSVRQHEVRKVLFNNVLLKYQDNLVLAMRDDVKCSEDHLKHGNYHWVISVKLSEPFEYCSLRITSIALLVYPGEMEPPEASTIKLDWSKGNIEKVIPLERMVSSQLEKVNIRVKIDRLIDVRPYSMDPLWDLTPDRPEGDMIFAVECEIIKVLKNCGLLKAKERTINGEEIRIFFLRDMVLINSKSLSRSGTLTVQMLPVQRPTWRCTGKRLMPHEIQCVKKRIGEEAQYMAKLVWCEICPSAQDVQMPENKGVTQATNSTDLTPGTSTQSEDASAWVSM